MRPGLALAALALLDVAPRCGRSNRPPPAAVGLPCTSQAGCPAPLRCYAFDPPRAPTHESQVCSAPCQADADCARWAPGLACLGSAREDGTHGAPLRVCARR